MNRGESFRRIINSNIVSGQFPFITSLIYFVPWLSRLSSGDFQPEFFVAFVLIEHRNCRL